MGTRIVGAKRFSNALAVICSLLASQAALARPVMLQTVDLSDTDMSAEGGEAKLLRMNARTGSICRIEVVHFGETGKMTYRFDFGSRLEAAVMQEIRYAVPLSIAPEAKVVSRRTVTLAESDGARSLPQQYRTYRAMFLRRHLARCTVRSL